jgi:Na+-driven multidrug efflux pump
MTNAATQTTPSAPAMDARTRMLLEGPIVPTLLRLGAPNVLVMLSQAAVGLIETYFIGKLGTDALAGMALAFPVVMLMTMLSAGAMGGAIASAIARALGARRREDADALVMHAVVIGLGLGLLFTVTILSGGRWLYTAMGGTGGALSAALTYSNWVFAGATLIWLFNSLSAVVRGTGNMAVPAKITLVGTAILIPLSPLLIFGWGPVPALGIAGGAIALLLFYFAGTIALALYLWSPKSLLRPAVRHVVYRWRLFRDILRVGNGRCPVDGCDQCDHCHRHGAGRRFWCGGDCRIWHGVATGVPVGAAGVWPRCAIDRDGRKLHGSRPARAGIAGNLDRCRAGLFRH